MVYLTKVLLLILAASLSVDCVIDRTYFIYLGLPISATSSDIQKAYDEKRSKYKDSKMRKQKNKDEIIRRSDNIFYTLRLTFTDVGLLIFNIFMNVFD